MKYGIAIDSGRCMACYNCYMACKDEHCGEKTPVSAPQPQMGQFWMNIIEWERGDSSRRIKTATVPTPCSHCEDAPCAKAATGGAIYTRPDGIVIIDPEKAKGQKAIADACPIGAIYWNEEYSLPQKCTMCAHLLDAGYKEPRCTEVCPNEALIFGDLDDPNSKISQKIAAGRVTQLSGLEEIKTHVVHLNIPTVFLAGTVYLPDDEVCIGAKVTIHCKECDKTFTGETNYFGDWEFEWLQKGNSYDVTIEYPGYKSVSMTCKVDRDHYAGTLLLEKA